MTKNAMRSSNTPLAWSKDRFHDYLAGPNAKLLVIGCGFRDDDVSESDYPSRGLKFFVIDPAGSDVVRLVNPFRRSDIYTPNALLTARISRPRPRMVGGTTQPGLWNFSSSNRSRRD